MIRMSIHVYVLVIKVHVPVRIWNIFGLSKRTYK